MITDKIGLEKKFNTIPNVQVGSLLRFNDNGELEAVSGDLGSIAPQIKVVAVSGSTVSCSKSGGASVAAIPYPDPGNTWYFNVPSLAIYTVTVKTSGTTKSYEIDVNTYKQYTVNAIV